MDTEPVADPPSRPLKAGHKRTPYQRSSVTETVRVLRLSAEGISQSEIARTTGHSQQTVSDILRRHQATTDTALHVLKANSHHAADSWVKAFTKAVQRGDHRPMKDLLVATGVIAPDPLAQGMVVIVGNGQATQTHVPQGFLLPDAHELEPVKAPADEAAVRMLPPSTTDTPGQ